MNIEERLAHLINQAQKWQMNDAHTFASHKAEMETEAIEKAIIKEFNKMKAELEELRKVKA